MTALDMLSPPNLIIASVVVVSGLAWLVPSLKSALILVPSKVREKGHIHRLLTAGWLHGDGNHLFFNLLSLHFFAALPLRAFGASGFVALYVSAVVVGFIPTTLRHMSHRRYASLGASGAVTAIMFSAILLEPGMKLHLFFIPVAIPAPLFAVLYLGYSVWSAHGADDGVNHDAHFTGAIYGVLYTYLAAPAQVARALRTIF